MARLRAPIALIASAAPAEEVRFAEKPAVKRIGDALEVSFALSQPGDVEVAIVDPRGKVVRHLAAGVGGIL